MEEGMTLSEMMEFHLRLFGRRKRLFMFDFSDRINFLNLGIGDMQDAVRKKYDDKVLGISLARVVSRIFCIAEYFQGLNFIKLMARKYPATHCAYCGELPCVCKEKRPAPRLMGEALEEQLHWSLQEWCTSFDKMYGKHNKERGVENLINRLFKELSELQSLALRVKSGTTLSQDEVEEEFALECADALAWAIAISNYFGVALEEAFWERYGDGCARCRKNPCICTHFAMNPIDWSRLVGVEDTKGLRTLSHAMHG